MAIGYFPAFLLGAFLLEVPAVDVHVVATPAGLPTVFLGLFYSTVCGGIGGLLAEYRTVETA